MKKQEEGDNNRSVLGCKRALCEAGAAGGPGSGVRWEENGEGATRSSSVGLHDHRRHAANNGPCMCVCLRGEFLFSDCVVAFRSPEQITSERSPLASFIHLLLLSLSVSFFFLQDPAGEQRLQASGLSQGQVSASRPHSLQDPVNAGKHGTRSAAQQTAELQKHVYIWTTLSKHTRVAGVLDLRNEKL
ncbi:hypothetical protein IRJ41_025748 [Triplophysa rosa]|uniref:Uncharacterized protein n=1 Tax=Triplophysa rosa TaxID=992332 RepID=A0A9W7WZU9_TRIRA|nr:hypothetical protein IRJ41_025748 [Triplophysa rosa]